MTGTESCEKIMESVNGLISGKEDVVRKVMTAIIAGGHILIEDIPGVGKTTMAKAFAAAMGLDNRRIQFTTDVMPSDITGFMMFDKWKNDFVFKPGAVMCNLLLADEINRTSSKTQAALLEVMEEGRVTIDGETKQVPHPFMVIATQNPIGSVGTTLLPESQLDRFMFRINMGYPEMEYEINMLMDKQEKSDILSSVKPIINKEQLQIMQEEAAKVFVHKDIAAYAVRLVNFTRNHPDIELGISPRGTIAIVKAAKALAYIEGRDYVIPDDIKHVLYDATNHRIVLSGRGKSQGATVKTIIHDMIKNVTEDK
ncbi:MAG: MoxR family ATPase [Lachnospiraceae bacterium]|nr:MoxR family ATPase [Lachnospiraceae bacterium]